MFEITAITSPSAAFKLGNIVEPFLAPETHLIEINLFATVQVFSLVITFILIELLIIGTLKTVNQNSHSNILFILIDFK